MTNRRTMLGMAAAAAGTTVLGSGVRPAEAQRRNRRQSRHDRTRVFLLGTAGGPGATPELDGDRTGIGSYVEVDGIGYVVDFGMGNLLATKLLGLDTVDMNAVFITHLHSDHTYEYGSVLYNKWARRVVPHWNIFGPAGLADVTQEAYEYFALDAASRYSEGGFASEWRREYLNVNEFAADGPVMGERTRGSTIFSDERVTVSAIPVNHPPLPSVAYRFDTPDLSVVFSGDTAPNDTLWRLAEDADILVHEAIDADVMNEMVGNDKLLEHILSTHSTPEQAGETATKAGVTTLVLSHLAPADSKLVPDHRWRRAAAETFDGEVLVGQDLMQVV